MGAARSLLTRTSRIADATALLDAATRTLLHNYLIAGVS